MIAGTRELAGRAWELRASLTPYDACCAVLAELLDAPPVTADRKLARALSSRGAIFLGDIASGPRARDLAIDRDQDGKALPEEAHA